MKHAESAELKEARKFVEAWRKDDGGPGSPVPEAVWGAAVAAARRDGIWCASRTLRLNYARLKARTEGRDSAANPKALTKGRRRAVVDRRGAGEVVEQAKFIDIGMSQLCGSTKSVVELCSRDGDRMRVEVDGAVDVVALTQTLLGGQR